MPQMFHLSSQSPKTEVSKIRTKGSFSLKMEKVRRDVLQRAGQSLLRAQGPAA